MTSRVNTVLSDGRLTDPSVELLIEHKNGPVHRLDDSRVRELKLWTREAMVLLRGQVSVPYSSVKRTAGSMAMMMGGESKQSPTFTSLVFDQLTCS